MVETRPCKQCSLDLPTGRRSFCGEPCRAAHDKARRAAERRGEAKPAKIRKRADDPGISRRALLVDAAKAQGVSVHALLQTHRLDAAHVYRMCKTGFRGREPMRIRLEKAGILEALK